MSEPGALQKLADGLTHSRGEAISLGDNLLVYLLNMALLHLKKRSNAPREAAEEPRDALQSSPLRAAQLYYLPSGPTEKTLLSLFTPLSQLRNEVDCDGTKGRITDSQEGAYQT
jgi:hypothetical protein